MVGTRCRAEAAGCRLPEPPQRHQVRHGLIARVVRVQVIAAVVLPQHAAWPVRVAEQLVEVDHAVEGAAGPDPDVDREPLRLLPARDAGRRECPAEHLDAALVRPGDDPLVAGDDLGGADVGRGRGADRVGGRDVAELDVVDPLLKDEIPDTGLGRDVAVEAVERALAVAGGAVEHAVAGQAGVQHRNRVARLGGQAAGEEVGPAVVRVPRGWKPSVIESPNATTAVVSAGAATSTPSSQTKDAIRPVKAAPPVSPAWSPRVEM